MSEQSVIIASVLIVILLFVVAFLGLRGNWRSSRPTASSPPPKKEPVFSNAPQQPDAMTDVGTAKAEEEEPQLDLPLMFDVPTLPPPDPSLLTADICYVIHFYGEKPLLAAAFSPFSEELTKHKTSMYRLLGYSADDDKWKSSLTESFPHWLVALPLADRGGQLKEDKIKLINDEARRFAQKLRLHPEFPSLDATLRRAKTLNDFCRMVDMVLEIRVRCPNTSSEQVTQMMATQKLVSQNGRYIYRVESESLFSVRTTYGGNVVTLIFTLDAPKVSSPERAFDNMTNCIRRAAMVLSGNVTDPNGTAITDERIGEIRRQLSLLRRHMTEYGVAPGGAMAHLLFS